jgi:hypothetical protein
VIELRCLRRSVDQLGFSGPIEVGIFDQILWYEPGNRMLECMKTRYLEHVLEPVKLDPVQLEVTS